MDNDYYTIMNALLMYCSPAKLHILMLKKALLFHTLFQNNPVSIESPGERIQNPH